MCTIHCIYISLCQGSWQWVSGGVLRKLYAGVTEGELQWGEFRYHGLLSWENLPTLVTQPPVGDAAPSPTAGWRLAPTGTTVVYLPTPQPRPNTR